MSVHQIGTGTEWDERDESSCTSYLQITWSISAGDLITLT